MSNDSLRNEIISNGISLTDDRFSYFDGKYIVPLDKGAESDTNEGWLPMYYVPTDFFIKWSTKEVKRLKTLTIKDRNKFYGKSGGKDKICSRFQNSQYYFKSGLTFSTTGVYSGTFRMGSKSIFESKSASVCFKTRVFPTEYFLGLLNSKIVKYLLKNYISHTVETGEGAVEVTPIPLADNDIILKITDLVKSIKAKQKLSAHYIFWNIEQKEIDKLVYELYGLNAEDINEVETWFARRYPKLADYAYFKPHAEIIAISAPQPVEEKIRSLIASGESKSVEFKSSLRFDLRENKAMPHIEHSSFKNLAAFLNTEGGTLLIGVEDNGTVLGLESTDYPTFKGANKKDEFLKHFDNLVNDFFGNDYSILIHVSMVVIDRKTVAMVEIKEKSSAPVFLKMKGNEPEEFYIRRNASAVKLTMHEFYTYANNHWKTS